MDSRYEIDDITAKLATQKITRKHEMSEALRILNNEKISLTTTVLSILDHFENPFVIAQQLCIAHKDTKQPDAFEMITNVLLSQIHTIKTDPSYFNLIIETLLNLQTHFTLIEIQDAFLLRDDMKPLDKCHVEEISKALTVLKKTEHITLDRHILRGIALASNHPLVAAQAFLDFKNLGIPLTVATVEKICLAAKRDCSVTMITNAFIEENEIINKNTLLYLEQHQSELDIKILLPDIIAIIYLYFCSPHSPYILYSSLEENGTTLTPAIQSVEWKNQTAEIRSGIHCLAMANALHQIGNLITDDLREQLEMTNEFALAASQALLLFELNYPTKYPGKTKDQIAIIQSWRNGKENKTYPGLLSQFFPARKKIEEASTESIEQTNYTPRLGKLNREASN